jgi:large subunit ribosomal protein L7e
VEELVHRRAYINVEGGKKPLTDNITVEKLLGDKDIICLNDMSHEIYTVGPHFDDATKILCPFNLSSPLGTFEKKVLKINSQERGFLGEKMEEFVAKIL